MGLTTGPERRLWVVSRAGTGEFDPLRLITDGIRLGQIARVDHPAGLGPHLVGHLPAGEDALGAVESPPAPANAPPGGAASAPAGYA